MSRKKPEKPFIGMKGQYGGFYKKGAPKDKVIVQDFQYVGKGISLSEFLFTLITFTAEFYTHITGATAKDVIIQLRILSNRLDSLDAKAFQKEV